MSRLAAARGSLACAAILLLAATAALAREDKHGAVVYLKDGYVLKGVVLQASSETIIDPVSSQPVTLHTGAFLVDDYCRRTFFSHGYVDRSEPRPFDLGNEIEFKRARSFPEPKTLPPIRKVLDPGDWTESWDRTYVFESPDGKKSISQHLAYLGAHYARANANCIDHVTGKDRPYPWSSYYRTREFGPDEVIKLLTLKDRKDGVKPTADRRFVIFNLLVQVGWLDAAEKELDRIKRDFPNEKEKVETAATGIKKLVALDRLDEIKRAQAAGRHESAQKLLAAFPTEGADDQSQAEVRTLKARYEAAGAALKRARELLTDLPKQVGVGDDPKLFTEAAAAVAAEMTLDHFIKKGENDEGRLERFLTQAAQAERFAKQKLPHLRPGELLSVAVTGWLLGPASAETKPEAARRVWEARRFVVAYQKTASPADRATLLSDYEGKSALGPAEMAQLIANLPPIDPPEKVSSAEVTMTTGAGGKGTSYQLKLPPEYHLGRPYPVLIALHNGGESGKDMIKRWADDAAAHGYILACPDWDQGSGVYTYTPAEHATVLDTLRDLRQHFNVDSDRVFLTGYGEGGNMVWDVGLSHPDLFAGLAPISGQPRYHGWDYWPNAIDLPVYTVWGEYIGGPTADPKSNGNLMNYRMFKENWVRSGFPAIGVQYRGRGLEWFGAEVRDIFEWMALKRRHNPLKVGFKDVVNKDTGAVSEYRTDLRTWRQEDNHFYWVSVDGIGPTHVRASAAAWRGNGTPATVAARIGDGNQIGVFASGVKRVHLWLGRGMIDFTKPVTINLNTGQKTMNNVAVKPSLGVLLEDFIDRGDRQRLYLARIEVK
jgi:pimeloyl-ACP methyl ester carboxylesterase